MLTNKPSKKKKHSNSLISFRPASSELHRMVSLNGYVTENNSQIIDLLASNGVMASSFCF